MTTSTTVTKRACSGCTMCCKLMPVTELNKPADVMCVSCAPASGCKIYATRPQGCKDFECLWLQGLCPEDLKPDEVRAVLDVTSDGSAIVIRLDPHRAVHPNIERYVKTLQAQNIDCILVYGDERKLVSLDPEKWLTRIGKEDWLVKGKA